jgi:ADP-heptose:LPS heptosyltransferase
MSYVILFILFLPIKLAGKLFRKETGKNLVIQTAKIGDFVNATPLLSYLQKSDVLISRAVEPLASRDDTIETLFLIGKKKRNIFAKFQFAWQIMNRYDNVYLLQPNSTNLFFAAVCNAKNKQFLTIYTRRWYHAIFYATAKGVVNHGKNTLSVTNYLQLADRSLSWQDAPKHATHPLYQPKTWPEVLEKRGVIRIGLSISAGNKAKTVPPVVWKRIFDALADLPCHYYIFGTESEQPWLDELYRNIGEQTNITSLLGQLPLEDVPWAISKMDCYIASDSGNVYIADAVNVPVVLLFGPCCYHEQRPLGDTLLIGKDENISSYVFETRYYFDKSREDLFQLTDEEQVRLYHFVSSLPHRAQNNNSPAAGI